MAVSDLANLPVDLPMTIATILLSVLVGIFHVGGLYLLFKVKRPSCNNNMVSYTNFTLLVLLSVSELSCAVFTAAYDVGRIKKQLIVLVGGILLYWFYAGLNLSAYYLITFNRLLSTIRPLWYRRSMTKKKFNILVLIICVVITSTCVACNVVISMFRVRLTKYVFICRAIILFLIVIYFVFCIFTYVAILITILKSRRNTQQDNQGESSQSTFQFICNYIRTQGYTIPFLITFTFLIFVVVPFTAGSFGVGVAWKLWDISFRLGGLGDALIYVLCDRDIRKFLKLKLSFIRDNVSMENSHSTMANNGRSISASTIISETENSAL